MRTYSTITTTGAVLATLLFAFSAFARDHTLLNGTWTLVPTKSDFAGQPVIQTGTVTINERDGDITVARSFAYEGATDTFFYRDLTDSENSATIHSGKDLKSKTKWDHDVLKVITTQSGAVTTRKLLPGSGWHHAGQRHQAGSQADHTCLPTQIDQQAGGEAPTLRASPLAGTSTSEGQPMLIEMYTPAWTGLHRK